MTQDQIFLKKKEKKTSLAEIIFLSSLFFPPSEKQVLPTEKKKNVSCFSVCENRLG